MTPSKVHSAIGPRRVRPVVMTAEDAKDYRDLAALGIHIDGVKGFARQMAVHAMDDTSGGQLSATVATPIQYLQTWLPGFVRVMTAARKADELVGLSIVGNWEDEEIVQGIMEPLGGVALYADASQVPLAAWNMAFERRTVVRFEGGLEVGTLEEARSARIKANTAAEKRNSVGLALDINRNKIAFFGYNGGANRTYGFLNDPSLPAYSNVPNGAGGVATWASKTYLEIVADIRSAIAALRTQMQDNYSPEKDAAILALPTNCVDYLGVVSTFGNSVRAWLKETYPAISVESAPELNAANGGANVFYLYAEKVNDGASDDSRTFVQLVPTKFQTIGVAKTAKGYVEDYSNATAGIMCKRPFAVVRRSGI